MQGATRPRPLSLMVSDGLSFRQHRRIAKWLSSVRAERLCPLADDQVPITAQHLKQVSRIKHLILEKYLPPWSRILGSQNAELAYFDCYAGPGIYELKGEFVEGSPIIAVRAAKDFLIRYPQR